MSAKEGLEKFNVRMDFALELLHKVLGRENTEEVLKEATKSEVFSQTELVEIYNKAQEAITAEEADRIEKINSLRKYLFQLLD
jgi:DNA-binding protein H-NS